jgi:serine/threonine protein kinase
MELCQGGDLLSYVRKRRKLKEVNAKYLFKQLVEGLNYIHTQKFVIHRDIKLDNILLDAKGNIKICDFGVSR